MINKSILIIGSGGFLGKNIVNNLHNKNYNNFVEIKGKNDLDVANYSKLNSF